MKRLIPVVLFAALVSASRSVADEALGIEKAFANSTDVPASVAADVEKNLEDWQRACLAETTKTTAMDALEAADIDLGNAARTLLLKPRLPSGPKSAWGCFCGAYACWMQVYSFDGVKARRILHSAGVWLDIIDRKDKGLKRLLLGSGSAGHQERKLYAWDGREYTALREMSVILGQGKDKDEKSEAELENFQNHVMQ